MQCLRTAFRSGYLRPFWRANRASLALTAILVLCAGPGSAPGATNEGAPQPGRHAQTRLLSWGEKLREAGTVGVVQFGLSAFGAIFTFERLFGLRRKRLKAWRLNEGLRKVHFKQGINRVLYRVENGNNITEFSLVASMPP